MLIAKIIVAAVVLVSVIAKAAMDHFWKDKRTKKYRYTRNTFVMTAIAAAVLNIVVLAIDERGKKKSAELEKIHQAEIENVSLGALTPDIWAFLYMDGKLVCPQRDTHFPGGNTTLDISSQLGIGRQATLCIEVVNTNSFPIYDFDCGIFEETPNPDGSTSVKNDEKLSSKAMIYPSEETILICAIPTNVVAKELEFYVRTRRGNTTHKIVFARAGKEWQYGSTVVDTTHGKQVSAWFSDSCPKDSNGIPFIRFQTVVKADVPNKKALGP